MRLQNRICIVTGAASGIGKADGRESRLVHAMNTTNPFSTARQFMWGVLIGAALLTVIFLLV